MFICMFVTLCDEFCVRLVNYMPFEKVVVLVLFIDAKPGSFYCRDHLPLSGLVGRHPHQEQEIKDCPQCPRSVFRN